MDLADEEDNNSGTYYRVVIAECENTADVPELEAFINNTIPDSCLLLRYKAHLCMVFPFSGSDNNFSKAVHYANMLLEKAGISADYSVGEPFCGFNGIVQSYNSACQALEMSFFFDENKVYSAADRNQFCPSESYDTATVSEQIYSCVHRGDAGSAFESLDKLTGMILMASGGVRDIAVIQFYSVVDKLRKSTNRKIFEFSSTFPRQYLKCDEKFKYALGLLKAYQSAACVITSRLHAAMPCLALETPVLLVRNFERHDGRFDGLGDLVRKADSKFYLNNIDYFDVNNCTPNGNEYLRYRKQLIERCETFTGQKHRITTPVVQIQSLEEQLVSNIEVVHNFGEREAQHKFSHWYLKKRMAKIKRHIYDLK